MGKGWDKFRLLMWKNFLLQYRKPVQTAIEILTPVVFNLILVALRILVNPLDFPAVIFKEFDPLPVPMLSESRNTSSIGNLSVLKGYELVYSPNKNTELDLCMNKLKNYFQVVKSFENDKEMEEYYERNSEKVFAGIEFQNELRSKKEIPEHVDVTFRLPGELRSSKLQLMPNDSHENNADFQTEFKYPWNTGLIYPPLLTVAPRNYLVTTGATPSYYWEGFLTLQVVTTYILATRKILLKDIFNASDIIDIFKQQNKIPILKMQRFPNAKWTEDPLVPAFVNYLGLITVISFAYTCISTTKVIATEKEQQLKEVMKIMGLPNWLHWTAWFTKSFAFMTITAVLIIVLYKVTWYQFPIYCIFTFTDPFVLMLFFVCYILATIAYCFAVSVFFSKANTAAAVAGIVWFFMFLPYQYLARDYDTLSISTKLWTSLLCNAAMPHGIRIILYMEYAHVGSQWDNIWKTTGLKNDISLGLIMVMLIVDALIYFLIAIYVETVFPGEFGVPQPFYFFVTKAYWCGGRSNTNQVDNIPVIDDLQNKGTDFFEREPDNLECAIQIKDLHKEFHKKVVVRNLSVNMYDNQITVLLGHNGAGKTTTLNMLMGMFPPTSGTAIINGFDIRHNMDNVRMSMGICPQHNVLFDELTVKEHLYFYSKLKGLSKNDIDSEIKNYVDSLELTDKLNSKSSTLSGGMKRKLNVAVAFCGRSKVVMLDEPSAGMDPGARRVLWNLIQKEKDNRIILLTTHFMDEADLLGDRIAIMAGGQLQCCGSSFFLKKKYGAGYRLILDKSKSCDTKAVTGLLKRHIRDIEVYGDVGSELTYVLMEKDSGRFEPMLTDLEANLKSLGVLSYGISLATLEEVFMKVGADVGQEEAYNAADLKAQPDKGPSTTKKVLYHEQNKTRNSPLLTGCSLIVNQFLAMMMKKGLSILRSWDLIILQNLIPVVFVVLAILTNRNINSEIIKNDYNMELTLDSYQQPVTLIETDGKNDLYLDFYKDALGGHKHEIVGNISKELLKRTEEGVSGLRLNNIVGVSIKGDLITTITAWFDNKPFHTPPLALGLALNIPYKQILGKSHSITFSNHPFPDTARTAFQSRAQASNNMGQQIAMNIAFSLAFVSSFYVMFYVKERVCKSKHLQFISGIKFYIFWITAYICDLLLFMITILVILITITSFQEDGLKTSTELGHLFILLFCFALAMLPLHYMASFLFDSPATGFVKMTLINLFFGAFAFIIIPMMMSIEDSKDVAEDIHWILLVFPIYSLAWGVHNMHLMSALLQGCKKSVSVCMKNEGLSEPECWKYICHNAEHLGEDYMKTCCSEEKGVFRWARPGTGYNILYCLTVGITLFLLLLIIQSKILLKISCNRRSKQNSPKPPPDHEDADVVAEKSTVHNEPLEKLIEENALVLKDLTKYYRKQFLAVNGICLTIKQTNCFGLLGTNGAGKTTTFQMLTGEESISSGNAWAMGKNIKTELASVQKLIGYCPQFDALLDDLTAKETLIVFALIRGVPLRDCRDLAETLAKDFDFSRHLKKRIKELSGGNKRKVSSAIAMIGDPSIIYLDEPTAGMDPATRRHLWDAICRVRDSGKCVVLTSHSMEECEALCTRIVIMVNGNFKCIGSTQHLKSKFGEGYTLTLKVKKSTVEGDFARNIANVEGFVQRSFPRAVQREKHQEMMTYYIEDKKMSLAKMFGVLEAGKKGANIEDYSLGQSSLEQVFLGFAKHQV